MNIKALRLKQFGCFDGSVRLEKFVPGLNILAGPNEFGKSTLFDALKVVFSEKFNSKATKSTLGQRIPYGGGAPVIEVDFELGEASYRLRKQFKSRSMAELKRIDKDLVLARNDEVEDELERLFGASSGGRDKTGLLWLSQGDALQPLDLADKQSNVLKSLIEQGVDEIGGGSSARIILQMVARDLAELVTPGRDQPRGAYKDAINAHELAVQALDAAKTALITTEDRRVRHQVAVDALKTKTSPDVLVQLEKHVEIAGHELAQARETSVELVGARERVERLTLARDAARKRRNELVSEIERITVLGPEIEAGEQARTSALAAVENARLAITDLEEKLSGMRSREEGLRQELKAFDAQERLKMLSTRREECFSKLEQARKEAALCEKLDRRLGEVASLTENGLSAIEREVAEISQLEDRLDAALTKISLYYDKGAQGRVRHGDHVLEDGARIDVDGLVTLTIEGVGKLKIDPGPMAGIEDVRGDLDAHQLVLTDLLNSTGVADLAEARAQIEEGRRLQSERLGAEGRLAGIAPDGIEVLEDVVAGLDDELSLLDQPATQLSASDRQRSGEKIRQEIDDLRRQEIGLGDAFGAAQDKRSEAQGQLGRLEEQLRNLGGEYELLLKKLPDPDARKEELQGFEKTLDEESGALTQALALVQSLEALMPNAEGLAHFESQFERAQSELGTHNKSIQALKEEIAGLAGILAHDRSENLELKLRELEVDERRWSDRVQKFKDDIAAMRKLHSVIEGAMAEVRSAYFEPVATRIAPYFETVFPDAEFNLNDGFGIESVQRSGRLEELARLSDGTQEQISVLVRLGYARLLSDRNEPLPLILDDALVYSDDDRMARLFATLSEAANYHQVIMLTCRAKSFEGLGGHRLEIESGEF